MPNKAKIYIASIIISGGAALLFAFANGAWSRTEIWLPYVILAGIASIFKLRLPGLTGTYSLGFLFSFYGIAHLGPAETLLATLVGGLSSSILNVKKRPTLVQIAFNAGTLALSVGAAYLLVRVILASEAESYRAAALVLAAALYFVINTSLVSGVLAMLDGKPLGEVCQAWYVWSFPYYMIGAAFVALIPDSVRTANLEAWLLLLPLIYLVHFFVGLNERKMSRTPDNENETATPVAAVRYAYMIVGVASLLLNLAISDWQCHDAARLGAYALLIAAASAIKLRLPALRGTMSLGFVPLLVAVSEVSLPEVIVLSLISGVVQSLWRPQRRPRPMQVLFGVASISLSSACSFLTYHAMAGGSLSFSSIPALILATLVLYGVNALIVAVMFCLVQQKTLGSIFQLYYFWSLPYYLVGAAAAGIMIATSRAAGWQPALMVFPMLALIHVSYRAHMMIAVRPPAA